MHGLLDWLFVSSSRDRSIVAVVKDSADTGKKHDVKYFSMHRVYINN